MIFLFTLKSFDLKHLTVCTGLQMGGGEAALLTKESGALGKGQTELVV